MDVVKAATFEAVIQSSITACDGQPLCLEEVEVGDEIFIGRQHLPMIGWILDGRVGPGPI